MPRLAGSFTLAFLAPFSLFVAACGGGSETGTGGGMSSSSSSSGSGSTATGTGGAGGSTTSSATTGTGGTGGAMMTGGAGGTGGTGGSVPTAPYHLVGRVDDADPARPTATWSGTTLRTRIDGTTLSVKLGGAKNVIFQIEIDGQPTDKLITAGGDVTYDFVSGLPAGPHDIALVRRNEGFFGKVAYLGLTPGAGTTIVETPWPYAHTLELVGDSLTAGYGIEGASASCNFSGGTESFYGTYGAIAARNVNAAVHGIAYSGKGVFQNYGGDKNGMMPELWRRTLTEDPASAWDFARFTPEAVVVNLGTNDFSAAITKSDFVGAYVDLLSDIRMEYPSALIFCVTWAHWGATKGQWVKDAMAMTGDPNLRHLPFSIDPNDGLGCDSHTNLVTNQKLGDLLTKALHDELGW